MAEVALMVTVGETRCKLSQVTLFDRLAAQRTERLRAGCPAFHQNKFHVPPPKIDWFLSEENKIGCSLAIIMEGTGAGAVLSFPAADLVPEVFAGLHHACCCFDRSCGALMVMLTIRPCSCCGVGVADKICSDIR
jgi:hypothetical protein